MAETIDGVLDDGAARGLRFFTDLTPRYMRAFPGAPTMTLQAIYTTYDAERGLNLQTLAATAASLQLALTTAKAQSDKQRQVSQVLPVSWQGEAATRGIEVVANLASHSSTDCAAVQKALDALNAVSTTMLSTVEDKVDLINKILVDGKVEVAGLTPADIDEVIDGKNTGEMDKAVWQKMLPGAIFPKKYPEQIKLGCENWLRQTFAFKYEEMLTSFTTACSIARTAVEGKYELITTAFNAIEERSYDSAKSVAAAKVDGQSAVPDNSKATEDESGSGGGSSSGGGTTAEGTQTGDTSASTGSPAKTTTPTTDTADDDTTTDDTDTSSALSTLTSAISELGATLSSALTGDLGDTLTSVAESVGTSISDGIEQLTEQASSLLSGEHEASFQLGDTKVSIEAGENGLSLTTTDANGNSQQYRLTLDENGLPAIEQESSSADPATAGDDTNGVLGSGTPESGTGQDEGSPVESGPGAEGATPPTAESPDPANSPVTNGTGDGDPSSGPVTGGVPAVPRSSQQEADGEHTMSVDDHQPSNPTDSGAVLSEAGPL
ncbi:hypothetical protein [Nocardia fluminea]|uniref:hypothetical protein n=1 Tax=Nocardia fluminea TaxID=134984 RepID=UPI003661DC39